MRNLKNIEIRHLNREKFNQAVQKQEAVIPKLGIKNINACIEYAYVDKSGNIVKLVCNESKSSL